MIIWKHSRKVFEESESHSWLKVLSKIRTEGHFCSLLENCNKALVAEKAVPNLHVRSLEVYSILTVSEKLNRLNNQKLCWIYRAQRTEGQVLAPRLEQGVMVYQTRDSKAEPPTGASARRIILNGNWCIAGGSRGQIWELEISRNSS